MVDIETIRKIVIDMDRSMAYGSQPINCMTFSLAKITVELLLDLEEKVEELCKKIQYHP